MASMVPEAARTDGKLRFDVYEADPRSGELRKHGVRISLEERPFRALLILLRRPNELVTREELQKQLWPPDTFVDFDHGLNTAIRKIRLALNDRASDPRFIGTVGSRGYRFLGLVEQEIRVPPERTMAVSPGVVPITAPPKSQNQAQEIVVAVGPASGETRKTYLSRRVRILAIAACAILLLVWYMYRPAMPLPRVTRVVQLTKSGGARPDEPLFTDGPRVYYESIGPLEADWQLRQVLLNGDEDTRVTVPAGLERIRGLSPDDTEFLAISYTRAQSDVWRIPVGGGSPRRVGNLVADDIAWSHDGNWFAYSESNQVFLANADGSSSRVIATLPEASAQGHVHWSSTVPEITSQIEHVRWSPDDRRLRFTLIGAGPGGSIVFPTQRALWEVGADGRNLHELRFSWPGTPMECCGEWTPDGRYFVFESRREGTSNLWMLEEKSDWWRQRHPNPVQLTFGPMNYNRPAPSRNGQSIFALGVQDAGELVRYNPKGKDFEPFLDSSSLAHLSFSRDGRWLAYVAYPEGTLWRARSDGTERLQLTFPPLEIGCPRWSADGQWIAYHARQLGQPFKNFVISANGGNPEPFPSESLPQNGPDWVPDRDALTYSRVYAGKNPGLYLFDRQSGRSEKLPGGDGLYGAVWSPDGHYLLAVDASDDRLFLVDLKAGKRTQIAGPAAWPTWSPDSKYIYFVRWGVNSILRVRVPDGQEEKILEVPFRLATWPFTLAPDGSLILLREHGRYDVYSLSLSLR